MDFMPLAEDINQLRSEGSQSLKEAEEKIQQLRNALKVGETTSGDPVTDFTVSHFGISGFDEEVQRPYRDLATQIGENPRNQILVVNQKRMERDDVMYIDHRSVMACMPPPTHYMVDLNLQMGVIANPEDFRLDVSSGNIVIPTDSHVSALKEYLELSQDVMGLGNIEWDLSEGDITTKLIDLPHLGKKLMESSLPLYLNSMVGNTTSSILFGDQVKDFFSRGLGGEESYAQALALLGEGFKLTSQE
jgi:hypothetical protein